MTKDQITRLAKEAGIRDCTCDGDFGCIERFAALIAKREWVGLTDEDILDALRPHYEEWEAIELLDLSSEDYKLIEAKLKEKNGL